MLLDRFQADEYVAYDTLVTLFFDFRYGSNYDLNKDEDRAVVERITDLDIELLDTRQLRPTALCGIFSRKS